MDKENKIIDLQPYIKPFDTCEKNQKIFKHQTNPILNKKLIISVKNNIHKFSINDLFD